MRRALSAFRSEAMSREEALRWLALACHNAHDVWDYDSWHVLATRFVQLARDAGALAVLPIALGSRTAAHVFAGEITAAASLAEEQAAVLKAIGSERAPYAGLVLAAWQGRKAEASRLIEATTKQVVPRGEGQWLTAVHWTSAVLYNGHAALDVSTTPLPPDAHLHDGGLTARDRRS